VPDFRPVMHGERYEDIPLANRPEFKGGILESDHPKLEAGMDIETKEIISTPSSERKDDEVKSGTNIPKACTDPQCLFAGSWHVHEGGGARGAGRTTR
jgi:hypothetical protein